MPCTTILVGKKASYDGSTIVARNEDSSNGEFCPKRFVAREAPKAGAVYRSVISHLEIELSEPGMRYTAMPNADLKEGLWEEAGFNERNVGMSATETITTNERVLAADPLVRYDAATGTPGGIGEEDMVTLVLPYATSARDGVLRLGALLERCGTYEMNGVAFSDADEIWWLETVGGHHWIARRVPDDSYVTMPNQLGIDDFDLDDAFGAQGEHLCSADLREWMAANHLDLTLGVRGSHFNPREAFGSHSDSDHVYNTPRAWAMQRFLSPHAGPWDTAAPAADFGPESDRIPWCREPERKVTIEDVKYVLSLHYQGTPYDPYGTNPAHAGVRGRYRPIGINRNSQLAVLQLRPDVAPERAALQWIAYGSNAFNALVPLYASVTETPAYFEDTTTRVTSESFYWANRLVGALADAAYGACLPHVERYQQALPARCAALIRACDAKGGSLEACNAAIADECRRQTEDLLDKVLYEASMRMRNAFSRSDG
ncbi:MAG TPA: C69 family dipeptidase [Candidatus Olsenella avicola]|uniref:C69 family dipeptidase n=1 Tax=Olsenella sp. An285 TaxID=1965621 RepID=UPI000B36CF12|nr:C69 family dipeptidase [Olsenella sp. An285]OUO47520.1 dipeptidase [Olsenella sp. An285]HIY50859.1 C69 family dipeptidase [Candidatus Olsenella avicola]